MSTNSWSIGLSTFLVNNVCSDGKPLGLTGIYSKSARNTRNIRDTPGTTLVKNNIFSSLSKVIGQINFDIRDYNVALCKTKVAFKLMKNYLITLHRYDC